MVNVIDGKLVAQSIYQDVLEEIKLAKEDENTPSLAVILVGDNPASQIYVKKKQSVLEDLGIDFKLYEFLPIATHEQIIDLIEKLNQDKFTHGILVQLPLPKKYNVEKILNKINPLKDVDSLTNKSPYYSPSASAIMEILKSLKVDIKNKKIVVIGKGKLVGRPFCQLAKEAGGQVLSCDKDTKNIAESVRGADIIVSAAGCPKLITQDMINKDQIIIDAGTSVEDGVLSGDVDFENIKDKVTAITPAKGGVGPVTIAALVRNIMKAYKKQKRI